MVVLREMERVCRPGGQIVVVNHFTTASALESVVDRLVAPAATWFGFRTDVALGPLLRAIGMTPDRVHQERVGPVWTLASWHARE